MNIESPKSNSAFRIADPDVGIAKDLYVAMMGSTEYADHKNSIAAFNSKLKKSNRNVSFTSKAGWMDWIDNNISITDFTDKVEFEAMYDDMINKQESLINAHKDLFTYIADADEDQLLVIFGPELDAGYDSTIGGVTTSSTCEDNCIDTADDAIDVMNEHFMEMMFYGQDSGSAIVTIYYVNEAGRWRDMELECIGSELTSCICVCINCVS